MNIGPVKMVSIKAVTFYWEMMMVFLENVNFKRDLQKEYFLNRKSAVSNVQTRRTEVQAGKQVGSKMGLGKR